MAEKKKAASIWDVARLAGVSHQTVSRVVNGSPRVADPTRAKVMTAIAELGYRPNRLARTLAGGAPQSVTVLTADTSLYGVEASLRGIEKAARAVGWSVSISVLDPADTFTDDDIISRLPRAGEPTIIIAHDEPGMRARQALLDAQPQAMVAVGPYTADELEKSPWLVGMDDGEAAGQATRYLLEMGHHTVHHLAIPTSSDKTQGGKTHRADGWAAALQLAGREQPDMIMSGWTIAEAFEAVQPLIEDRSVTAILCGNDDLALGALRAAHQAGRDVPGDLSIVGFDNAPFTAYTTPAITTVNQDFLGLGRGAFELLRHKLDGSTSRPAPCWPDPELIVRETSGPPPRR
ncbi:LacI family DNA-binding transcriptional regulator [Glycomyces buryatensis]|uniref:LacI family transcriptional regulator n=1 Tax=Glycomyces buryatensis TaxID=2570927 RepID=A0A4S8QIK1_9ACTN|nr:LacI family DNA-binding transcriptional regulator [Glycomyces buryatensis]THV42825.1 LacI family transcriptional regulator [Glycomyces buryatensis]